MGLFTRKKKSVPSSIRSAPSPSASFSTICPSPPVSPVVAYFPSQPFFNPQITLRVALDPAPIDAANSVFTITIDHDADIGRVRSAIAETIGHTSTSLFKVSLDATTNINNRSRSPFSLILKPESIRKDSQLRSTSSRPSQLSTSMTPDNLPLAWDSLGRPHLETFHQSCACEIGFQNRRNKNAFQSLSALRKALPVSVGEFWSQ